MLFNAETDAFGGIFIKDHRSLLLELFSRMLCVSLHELRQKILVPLILVLIPRVTKDRRLRGAIMVVAVAIRLAHRRQFSLGKTLILDLAFLCFACMHIHILTVSASHLTRDGLRPNHHVVIIVTDGDLTQVRIVPLVDQLTLKEGIVL